MACTHQVHRAGMDGQPTGMDLGTALRLAEARGLDAGVMAELLSAYETGMVEALAEKRQA